MWLSLVMRETPRFARSFELGSNEVVFTRAEADIRHRLMGIFWKAARIGERLSPYISLCCVFMAVGGPRSRFPLAALLLLYPSGQALLLAHTQNHRSPSSSATKSSTRAFVCMRPTFCALFLPLVGVLFPVSWRLVA